MVGALKFDCNIERRVIEGCRHSPKWASIQDFRCLEVHLSKFLKRQLASPFIMAAKTGKWKPNILKGILNKSMLTRSVAMKGIGVRVNRSMVSLFTHKRFLRLTPHSVTFFTLRQHSGWHTLAKISIEWSSFCWSKKLHRSKVRKAYEKKSKSCYW